MKIIDFLNKIKNKIELRLRSALNNCKNQKNFEKEDSFEDKAPEKFIEKDAYITEEECEEYVKYLQKKELESERYKEIKQFLIQYHDRDYIDLEKRLFELVGDIIEIRNKSYNTSKTVLLERYIELKEFVDSLNNEHINRNPYLSLAKTFMATSLEDCESIKKQLTKKIADFFESHYSSQEFNIIVKMSEEAQSLIPKDFILVIRDEKIQNSKFTLSTALEEKYMSVYREYNEYSIKAKELINVIYCLQVCNMTSTYPVFFYFALFEEII